MSRGLAVVQGEAVLRSQLPQKVVMVRGLAAEGPEEVVQRELVVVAMAKTAKS